MEPVVTFSKFVKTLILILLWFCPEFISPVNGFTWPSQAVSQGLENVQFVLPRYVFLSWSDWEDG